VEVVHATIVPKVECLVPSPVHCRYFKRGLMPIYEYRCTACDERLEVEQRFSDDALTTCPACGGALQKVFSAVGVVFKGSGFYKTDSRSAAKAAKSPAKADAAGSSESTAKADATTPASTSDSTSPKKDAPAAAAPAGD
jgi:putative FmdB family regulatory protein